MPHISVSIDTGYECGDCGDTPGFYIDNIGDISRQDFVKKAQQEGGVWLGDDGFISYSEIVGMWFNLEYDPAELLVN